ncbi:hypothetical protein ACFWP2_36730, partial [Kitasatospora sp. NPDC058444]|uniref:hypothetical protein n=1 Tax=Kitasatospora sp. NPDC058444 TaxID=3346504 RepID=UPI0036530CAF
QKNLRPGMSTYLALTFGTLLSSQGTDASFGPLSSGPSGLRSFVFPAYQMFSAPFTGASFIRFPLGGFPANFIPKPIKAFGVLSPWDLLRRRVRIS